MFPSSPRAQLVQSGQIEFVIGGWTMEDEACTTYGANIDQMTEGHQFIVSHFGEAAAPRHACLLGTCGTELCMQIRLADRLVR